MSRFNTGNPIGSGSPLDLDDNAKNLDVLVNSTAETGTDRFGNSRLTYQGMENGYNRVLEGMGLYPAAGSFEAGGTITDRNQYLMLINSVGSQVSGGWTWSGALPKTVPPGSTPASSGGIGPNAWVYRGDTTVLSALADGTANIAGVTAAKVAEVASGWGIVYVEDYRQPGMNDSEVINAALNYIKTLPNSGYILRFGAARQYIYIDEHSIGELNDLWIDLNGSTLRRAAGSNTAATLTAPLTVTGGTVFTVNSVPATWKVGDYLTAFTSGNDADTSRDRRRIANISGNQITITGSFFFSPAKVTLPAGTTIAKAYSLFAGRPSLNDSATTLTQGVNRRIFITNGTINGNRGSQLNVSWRFIPEIGLHSIGGVIDRVRFINITSESFVGHGVSVVNCVYEDIGGSCYHTSVNDATKALGGMAYFAGNTCKRINIATNDAVGHSEGALTFSWNPGNFIVKDNIFIELTEYFLGRFAASNVANGGENLIVSGNIVRSSKGIFETIFEPSRGVHIAGNVFHDCGDNIIQTRGLCNNPLSTFANNTLTGTTLATEYTRSTGQWVGAGSRSGKTLNDNLISYLVNVPVPAYTPPPFDNGVTSALEKSDGCFQAMISNGQSGLTHFHPGGTAAGSAFLSFNPSDLTYNFGTNISGGGVTIRVGGYTPKINADTNGVDMLNFNGLSFGDKNTNGSWQINFSGNNLVFRRREAGVWVVKSTISA